MSGVQDGDNGGVSVVMWGSVLPWGIEGGGSAIRSGESGVFSMTKEESSEHEMVTVGASALLGGEGGEGSPPYGVMRAGVSG